MKHEHRILPGHMGGEYAENNVVLVEVTKCNRQTANHVMWHYANWRLWHKEEDKIAWKGLAGFYGKEEIIHERSRLGGRISGAAMRDSGRLAEIGRESGKRAMSEGGWLYERRVEYGKLGYSSGIGKPENRMSPQEQSELAKKLYAEGKGLASLSPEEKTEAGRRGGAIGGSRNKENKTGVCGIPPEEHSKRMSETNKQKWACPVCGYTNIARHVNKHMLEEHNLTKDTKIKVAIG